MKFSLVAVASVAVLATGGSVPSVQAAMPMPQQQLTTPTTASTTTTASAVLNKRLHKEITNSKNIGIRSRGGAAAAVSSIVSKDLRDKLLGTVALAGMEKLMKVVLRELDISFPPMLAGCLTLFTTLILLDHIRPSLANSIATFLTPGTAFLAKWFPMFFVPGLVLLPLAPSVGGTLEITKMLGVVIVGLVYSMISVAATTMVFRGGKLQFGGSAKKLSAKKSKPAARVLPYSAQLVRQCGMATAVAGAGMLLLQKTDYAKLVETICLTLFTMTSYMWAARLPAAFVQIVHPLVTSCVLILTLIQGMSILMNRDFHSILRAYKVGSLNWKQAGSADILMYLLGPSAVSFAIGMYDKRALLKQNLVTVLAAVMVSSLGGLYGTAALVRLISLGGKLGSSIIRLSMLSRNVTTALALPLTSMLGGDLALAAAVVCMTGVMGATYGKPILEYFGIQDPVMRGLAVGGAAQGLGVASMADEKDAFPFAAIAMVLNAVISTTLVTVPAIKNSLVKLATGN